MLQYRPVGSNEPAYNPERDIAWTLEAIAHNIPTLLSPQHMPSWLGAHAEEHRITDAQMEKAVGAFMKSVSNCRDPEIVQAKDALAAAGFWDLPDAHKLPVFAALGMVVFGFYFKAVREATLSPNAKIPKLVLATPDMVDALQAGSETIKREHPVKKWLTTKEGRPFSERIRNFLGK